LLLDPSDDEAKKIAEKLYADLQNAKIDALFDDREERPGVKFKDHDLIGIPLQIVIGARGIKNGVIEMKTRRNGEKSNIAIDEILGATLKKIEELRG
jgi:prolyl-tRNA synthetase